MTVAVEFRASETRLRAGGRPCLAKVDDRPAVPVEYQLDDIAFAIHVCPGEREDLTPAPTREVCCRANGDRG